MTFPDRLLLADKSAWERASLPSVRDAWREAMLAGRIVTCMPVRYELLYSTRSRDEFDELEAHLSALRDLPLTAAVQRTASAALRALAHLGGLHHRLPLADLLIAAVAHEHGAVVVHDDAHFETIARVVPFDQHRISVR